jgi:hypothetical protein
MSGEASFETIAERVLDEPDVTEGTGFGSSPGLRVEGRIFAMLVTGGLVVKLPASRCAELVTAGIGRPFDRGQGRPLKQWAVISDSAEREWVALAREALAFVRPQPNSKAKPTRRIPKPKVLPAAARTGRTRRTPA